jgi:hypothetical protein
MDFNGQLDRPEPRLHIAYGEFVSDDLGLGVLGGQAYATMLDLRAVPETFDFAGPAGMWQTRQPLLRFRPAGMWQTRQPLLRFTKTLAEGTIMEVSVETPENVSYINAEERL